MGCHTQFKETLHRLMDEPTSNEACFTQDERTLEVTQVTDSLVEVDYRVNGVSRPKLIFNTQGDWTVTYFENSRYNIQERMPRESHICLLTEKVASEIEKHFTPSTE